MCLIWLRIWDLVEDGSNFLAVESDGEEGLLVVVGGDVEDEEIGAAHGCGEDAGVGVHASANVAAGALKWSFSNNKYLFPSKSNTRVSVSTDMLQQMDELVKF